jgi:DNA-binding FadR family transcriptional regulator
MAKIDHLIKKIPRQKISDRVFEQVKDLITTGKFLPGQKIPGEIELTSLFDVSRSSVREAILKLECLGFVEQKRGEGTFVKSVTQAPIQNYMEEMLREKLFLTGFMEVRDVLETWAAATAAIRADQEEIDQLKEIIQEMRNNETGKIGYELNVKLHRSIAMATHNPFIVHMMGSILSWLSTITDQVYTNGPENLELQHQFTKQYYLYQANKDKIESAYPPVRYNTTGYNLRGVVKDGQLDLRSLFAGSEGILGIVTRLKFRLIPRPAHDSLVVAYFDDIVSSARAVENSVFFRVLCRVYPA